MHTCIMLPEILTGMNSGRILLIAFLVVAILGVAVYLIHGPSVARAEAARFDHVFIVSATYLYNGRQGVLLLDQRNGNVWFFARNADNMKLSFMAPEFVVRLPLERLDQNP